MSSQTLRGRATASSAARLTLQSAFAAIRRRLLAATIALSIAAGSPTLSRQSVSYAAYARVGPSKVSGASFIPMTPLPSSTLWDASHLKAKYGIAVAVADEDPLEPVEDIVARASVEGWTDKYWSSEDDV